MQEIKFLQINLQTSKAATENMVGFANSNKIEVLLLQDYYNFNDKIWAIPDSWQSFTSTKMTAAVVVTRRDIEVIHAFSDENTVFVNITTTEGKITVGSIYSRPKGNLLTDMKWIDYFDPLQNIIIGADLNVHLTLLGYVSDDERGNILSYLLLMNNLTLVNDTEAPSSFIGEAQRPCQGKPDVTLCTQELSDYVSSWYVDTDAHTASDHRYIRFSLTLKPRILTLNRYKTRYTNFIKFNRIYKRIQLELHGKLEKVTTRLELDEWLEKFNEETNDACRKSFKIKKLKLYPTFNWWNDKLKIHRNKISALYKRFKKSGDQKWRIKINQERAKYKLQIKHEKIKSWQNFCTKTTDRFGQAFKIAIGKKLKHQHFIHTLLDNSPPYSTKSEIFTQLLDHHFPTPNTSTQEEPDPVLEEDPQTSFPPLFSFKEIKSAFKEQNNLKAPGIDNLDAFILKNINKHYKHLIRDLLNKCLTLNYFPHNWKIAQVIFFSKRLKDPKLPSSYRPICLLPMLGKVYERLIKHRINYYLENNNFFHQAQFGFREGKNTTQLLQKIKQKIKSYLQTNKYCALISFDIVGAFDNINWKTLKTIILKLPIPKYLKLILISFLTDRHILTDYLQNLNKRNTHQGCPQGSCLGPLLWLLIANEILKIFNQKYEDLHAFCDDFNVIIRSNSRQSFEKDANEKIKYFQEICTKLKLTVSPTKTQFMLTGKNLMEKREPILRLGSQKVEQVKTLKLLGITLQENLNWDIHLNEIKNKIILLTSSIKRMHSATWGVNREFLRGWYVTVLEKVIDYASEVWFDDLRVIDKRCLQSIQRLCLLSITKCYKNVATHALQVLLGIPPILITLHYKNLKSKILENKDLLLMRDKAILNNDIEQKIPKYQTNPEIHINNLIYTTKELLLPNLIKIYTDGSHAENKTTYAVVAFSNSSKIYETVHRIQNQNTVFQAELQAVVQAVQWALSSSYNKFQIFSDSQSTILSILNPFPNSKTILNLHQHIKQYPQKLIYLTWVKGHAGNKGNELADELANSAAQCCDLPIDEGIKLPRSYLNKCIKSQILERWQYNWDNSGGGRFAYSLVPKVQTNLLCKDRVSLYFLTGCGSFPTFLHKINKKDNDLCQCGKRGDPVHYLFEKCKFMKHKFQRQFPTLYEDINEIVKDKKLLGKLYENYNILNQKYSFIKYKFILN